MTPKVLVVEEQPALRRKYETYLRRQGYDVASASSPDDILSLTGEQPFDAIILDPDGGGGRGMEVALALLRSGTGAALVFNTSSPHDLETDFSSWIADAYAVRSQDAGELGQALRRLLPAPEVRV
jgi:DNA-binding response OmpR family regulator